jgi:glyoxylase-like metal-dependent hydrolase (beta-lactamase superfamily II)
VRVLSLAAASAIAASSLVAQHPAAPTILDQHTRARRLIDAAVAAHGGIDKLRAIRNAHVSILGWDYHPTQGRRLTPPFDSTPRNTDVMTQLDAGRLVNTTTRGWPGGFSYVTRFATRSETTFNIQPRSRTYSIINGADRADQQFGNLFAIPPWYLLAAAETGNPGAVRYLGRVRLGQTQTDVEAIHYTIPPSGNIIIGFDPQSHQLRAVLGVGTDVFTGDTEVHTEYLDWRMIGDLLLPTRAVRRRGGNVVSQERFVASHASWQIPDSLLSPPAGFAVAPRNAPQPPVAELASGVWMVGGGSRAMIVAFNDHVVVVDAPASGSGEAIRRAAELAPGKPIRSVIPTHHHDDHFIGVRYHAANGTTIVTTPGNGDYLRRIMTAPMSSLMLASNQVPAKSDYKVEMLTGDTRVFTDGTRRLEIHRMQSPHADDMLVAWLPTEGILFTADLIEAPPSGVAMRGANAATTMHLADVIRAKGWDVRTFAGAHATLRNPSEFAALVQLPIIPAGSW